MKLLAFAVFDSKAEAFLRPFFAETEGLALRSFTDAVQDPQSPMSKHTADYTLYRVGEYDQVTGILSSPVGLPAVVVHGVAVKELRVS